MKNFAPEVDQLVRMIEPEGVSVQPESREIAQRGFEELELRYGNDSDNPLSYHNAPHGIDTTARAINIGNMIFHLIPENYQYLFFDKIIVGTPFHDNERFKGSGENERLSSERATTVIEEYDGSVLDTDEFKGSIHEGIMGTQAERGKGGIVQVNLRKGSPDPFILVEASADVGAIPMEGSRRMIRDAVDLCFEENSDPTAQDIYDRLLTQAGFIRSVTHDSVVIPNMQYYLPDTWQEVYKLLRSAFNPNTVSAYRTALLVEQSPHLQSALGHGIHMLDRLHVGSLIVKALERS